MATGVVRVLVVVHVLWLALLAAAPPAGAITSSPVASVASTGGLLGLEQVLRVVFAATAFSAIGVLLFVATTWEGSGRELAMLCRVSEWTAFAAAVVVVAQIGVRAAVTADGWSGAAGALPALLAGSYGIGMTLRAAGAVLLSMGASSVPRTPAATLPATAGAVLIVGSFAFAGYASGTEPRLVSTLAIVAHVAAAAAWGGGLLALVVTFWHRSRVGTPLRAGYVAARFSVVATVAVALVAAAGVALAIVRLDSLGALWQTTYGLTLVTKVVLVATVAGVGAYNHFVVVPVLRVAPDHAIGRRLHRLGTIEIALFVAVIGVNSALVGLAG